MSWRIRHLRGSATELFADDPLAERIERTVTFRTVRDRAVVLGSAQRADLVDPARADAAGVSVVRRRSGGGAVWLDPESITWVDVTIPIDDPLWDPDVGRAFWWLGDVWAGVLASLGVLGAMVHHGPLVSTPWSKTVCFAGLGPGEITIDGRKVVGIAQRRTRAGALFQCGVLHAWDPGPLLAVLALSSEERADATVELRDAGFGVADLGLPGAFREALRVSVS